MEGDSPEPRDALDEARSAASQGDFQKALIKYEYFFDHALDDDPAALYGVRLSYCLNEWARIGRRYEPAHKALVERKADSLHLFEESKDPERFHDFVAICKYLKRTDEAISEFVRLDGSDFELARTAYRFISKDLVEAEEWELCGRYIDDSSAAYELALSKFDEAWSVGQNDDVIGGGEYNDFVRRMYVRDVSSLLLILKHCNRTHEYSLVRARIAPDMTSRKQAEVVDQINAAFSQ
jgi:uncharacterized protein YozE (UPF0346 family)